MFTPQSQDVRSLYLSLGMSEVYTSTLSCQKTAPRPQGCQKSTPQPQAVKSQPQAYTPQHQAFSSLPLEVNSKNEEV
jgi:hypothetical protein